MTMIEYSDDESSSSSNSSESEILPRKTRQRTFLEQIKENPDLYTTRRSERNRKEPSRLNIQASDKSSRLRKIYSGSSSDEKFDNYYEEEDDDSDGYSRRKKKRSIRPNREFRKRAHVSYKEAESTEDDGSDDSSLPKKKSKQFENTVMRDNPLMSRPVQVLRRLEADQDGEEVIEETVLLPQEETNVIEDVLSIRIGYKGNTGTDTTYYLQKIRRSNKSENHDEIDNSIEESQFLIKWRNWSHIHSTWESESSLKLYPNLDGMKKLHKFREIQQIREHWKKYEASPEDLDAAQFEEERNEVVLLEKMECERVIDCCPSKNGVNIDYLVKWWALDYRYSTWESGEIIKILFPDAITAFNDRNESIRIPNRKCEVWSRRPKYIPIREQPEYIAPSNSDLTLRDYQLDGINWIARAWTRGNSAILADEMGLGKTIQTIGFLAYLFNQHCMYGPFLLVVPLSTIGGWQTELAAWAPFFNVIVYTGDAISRQVIRECEWHLPPPKKKVLKFHICITTYELLLKDKAWLNQISWAFLGIDEAHRLKNDESQLYSALMSFNTNTRLLITGTPVHNSLKELWALLHFIMPDKFDKWHEFEERYNICDGDQSSAGEVYQELYRRLEPFLMRRTKKDVEKSLPSKSEQIIRVPMCKKQAEIYKLILTKNYDALSKETRGHTSSFLNVVMELKKCCNHIQLVNPLDDETESQMDSESRLRYVIKSSGKMMLLDKLMFEMKEHGHRVLIFSQMVRMLDIISDYLILRGWGFQRLDGSIKGNLRKQAIDHFNTEGSTDFCFLLSTRAGGLGINLATADTVVIFDSDWNPQNDLQAMARAHRIGQKKQVSVYRFVIKNSIEEKIIECAKKKMVLDHLVIQRMDSALRKKTDANKNQPFNKDELNEILKFGAADLFNQDESMDEEHELNIHDILQRAETQDNDTEVHNPASELLSAFKVVNVTETAEDEDIVYIGHKGKPKLWSEIVPQEFRDKVREEEQQKTLLELNLGPRQRKKVKSYQVGKESNTSSDSSEEENDPGFRLSEKEIRAIVRVMKKFPRPQERLDSVMIEAEVIERDKKEIYEVMKKIIEGCHIVLSECDTDEKRSKAILTIGRINIPAKAFLQTLEDLDILHQILPSTKSERLQYQLPFETKLANWSCIWETVDDARLLVGVYEKGMDNWESIKMESDLNLSNKILPLSNSERPQASHLKTRVEYLLKKLRDTKNIKESSVCKINVKVDSKRTNKKLSKVPQKGIKSAEFVEESDSSKGSVSLKTKNRYKSKNKSKNTSAANNASVEKMKVEEKQTKDIEYDEAEEALFYDMKGPLFVKCKRKMKPIKKELKFLEDLQNKYQNKVKQDDEDLTKCLLCIGNHIRSIIIEFKNDEAKRKWRNYLWSFVSFFFDVFPKENLHRIYKSAFKKSSELKKKKREKEAKSLDYNTSSKTNNSSDKFHDKPKCNFEARSYQEYKIMKKYTGESSHEKPPLKYEKQKPYYRQDHNSRQRHEDKYNSSYHDSKQNKHRSNYENNYKYNHVNDRYEDSHRKNYKLEPNNSRDPRLSKSTLN